NVNNTQVLMPASKLAASKGVRTVALDPASREQAKVQAATVQRVALQRTQTEVPVKPGAPIQPRVASLSVPKAQPVGPARPQTPTASNAGPHAAGAAQPPQVTPRPGLPAGVSTPRTPGTLVGQQPGTTPPGQRQGIVPATVNPNGVRPATLPGGPNGQHPPGV